MGIGLDPLLPTEDADLWFANKELREILVCVYCGNELADARTPCCGELHSEWIGVDDENE